MVNLSCKGKRFKELFEEFRTEVTFGNYLKIPYTTYKTLQRKVNNLADDESIVIYFDSYKEVDYTICIFSSNESFDFERYDDSFGEFFYKEYIHSHYLPKEETMGYLDGIQSSADKIATFTIDCSKYTDLESATSVSSTTTTKPEISTIDNTITYSDHCTKHNITDSGTYYDFTYLNTDDISKTIYPDGTIITTATQYINEEKKEKKETKERKQTKGSNWKMMKKAILKNPAESRRKYLPSRKLIL